MIIYNNVLNIFSCRSLHALNNYKFNTCSVFSSLFTQLGAWGHILAYDPFVSSKSCDVNDVNYGSH